MSFASDAVLDFMWAFDQPVQPYPTLNVPQDLIDLRVELIREEFQELKDDLERGDVVGVADALGDLLYVIYGAAHSFGIDIDTVFREIHRSNMTKLGPDGKPITRADGKAVKGPNYEPPNIKAALAGVI